MSQWLGGAGVSELSLSHRRTRTVVTVLAEWTNNKRGGGVNIPLKIPLAGPSRLKHREVSCYFVFWWQQAASSSSNPWRQVQERWRLLVNFLHNNLEAPPREELGGGCRCCWGKDEWIYGSLCFFSGSESTKKKPLCGWLYLPG